MFLDDMDRVHNPSFVILCKCGWRQCVSTPVHCGSELVSDQRCLVVTRGLVGLLVIRR